MKLSDKSSGIVGAGAALAELRIAQGYTVSELAEKIGTSKSALSQIENDKRPVSLTLLERLAKPLKWSPEALILFCLRYKYRTLTNERVLAELEDLSIAVRRSTRNRS